MGTVEGDREGDKAELSGSASSCAAAAAPLSAKMPPRKKARKNASPATAAGGRDDISDLPDAVLQHMLSFLPAQDAVRTCVLAKRWRHMWKSTSGLRLVCGGTKEILEFVDHLLRLRIRGGTPLDTCQFFLDESEFDISRIILWICVALQCKVRVLQFICENIDYQDISPRDGHPLFISQWLKKIELRGLDVVPSGFLDFSFCPNLEDLEIVECFIAESVLISSESLKRLTIHGYFYQSCRLPICICAPNLVSLWLEVGDGRTPSLSLQMIPSLVTVFIKIWSYECDRIYSDFDDGYSNQCILFQGLSDIQNLVLMSLDPEMFIFRRDLKFCSSFNKLKSLLINEYWCEPADFSALACLLKLSPVLEKLTLQLYSVGPKQKVEIKLSCKPLEISAEISQHLKTLEVKCPVFDERINNVLTFLNKKLNIWFQFSG